MRSEIHGMVHCSGGAQTKILHFVDDLHIIKDNLFDVPPYLTLYKKNQKPIGRRCIESLTWGTEWNFI